jgi:hypothetical protein
MRRILIERARRKSRLKRGSGQALLDIADLELGGAAAGESMVFRGLDGAAGKQGGESLEYKWTAMRHQFFGAAEPGVCRRRHHRHRHLFEPNRSSVLQSRLWGR